MNDSHTPLQNASDGLVPNPSGMPDDVGTDSPQVSTTSHQKETEPISSAHQEMMEPVKAPEINKEVLGYIEQREKMKVPPDLKSMGVLATDDVHGSTGPTFPISDEKIEEGLHQPVNSSWRWLSQFLLYHLERLHLTLKKVHGHVVRVARG